jgi:hypothetical protein
MRPFWQILISFRENHKSGTLTCDECFRFMEHLAEEALAGAEQDKLKGAVRKHLKHCPDCQEHHLIKLAQMESKVSHQHGPKEDPQQALGN